MLFFDNGHYKKCFLFITSLIALINLTSCNTIRNFGNTEIKSGIYKSSKDKLYITTEFDTIKIYSIDTESRVSTSFISLPNNSTAPVQTPLWLRRTSFDIDILTVPLKMRPPQSNVPMQMNPSLNAAVFLGVKQEFNRLKYRQTPIANNLQYSHYGISLGILNGIGNTFMSPTNTANLIDQEYDGIVWLHGLTLIFGIDRYNFGLTMGRDYLLDNNASKWIYHNKIWYGISLGININ